MNKDKKTTRSKGEHLKKKEVKIEIIRYILSEDDKVSGPDITKHLLKKYNIVDEKNIRNHLRDLQKQHCIEKIKGKPGLENKWVIEKIENLWNIQECYPEENYPDMQLNKYVKSLYIVYEDQSSKGYFLGDYYIYQKQFLVQLFLSDSFFHACLDKDMKTLCGEAYEYYRYGEGFYECKHIQNQIDKFYNDCTKLISISPKIWLDFCNVNTSNFSELESHQNIIKNLPATKISKETFRKIIKDDIWRFDSNKWKPRLVEELSIKLANIICQKMLNNIPIESRKKWEKELKAKSIDILKEMLEEIPASIDISTAHLGLMKKLVETQASIDTFNANSDLKEPLGDSNINSVTERIKETLELFLILNKEKSAKSNIILGELYAKITYEIFQMMFKDIPVEFLDTSELFNTLTEILKKILEEVIHEIRVIPDEKFEPLTEITDHRIKTELLINQIMFKHYFDRDIEGGAASNYEKKYIVMMKNFHEDLAQERKTSRDVEHILDYFLKIILKKAESA